MLSSFTMVLDEQALFDLIAEALRSNDADFRYRLDLAQLSGPGRFPKITRVMRALRERGLRVGVKMDHEFAKIGLSDFVPDPEADE